MKMPILAPPPKKKSSLQPWLHVHIFSPGNKNGNIHQAINIPSFIPSFSLLERNF